MNQIQKEFYEANINMLTVENVEEITQHSNVTLLGNVGLRNSSTFKKIVLKEGEISKIQRKNSTIEELIAYQATYPGWTIINLTRVIEIMTKYGLVIGDSSYYEGMIPEKNIKELRKYYEIRKNNKSEGIALINIFDHYKRAYGTSMFIVASRKLFKKQLTDVSGFLLDIEKPSLKMMDFKRAYTYDPDPIMLCPLFLSETDEKFFHIVTAWDIEAEELDTKTEYSNN